MGEQTYIPAGSDNPDPNNIEALLHGPLSLAETGIRKLRPFLLLNLLNAVWVVYFYKMHTEASLLWLSPVLLLMAMIIGHQWILYFSLRELLRLPAKINKLGSQAMNNTANFFHEHENTFAHLQERGAHFSDATRMYGAFGDMRNLGNEAQDMMSVMMRTVLLGNPLVLGLSLGLSSLTLFAGIILLVIHVF